METHILNKNEDGKRSMFFNHTTAFFCTKTIDCHWVADVPIEIICSSPSSIVPALPLVQVIPLCKLERVPFKKKNAKILQKIMLIDIYSSTMFTSVNGAPWRYSSRDCKRYREAQAASLMYVTCLQDTQNNVRSNDDDRLDQHRL